MSRFSAVEQNVEELHELCGRAKAGTVLKKVLQEVCGVLDRYRGGHIVIAPASGQAHTLCVYDKRTHLPIAYKVETYTGVEHLVHELIHVCVNDAYGRDFVNYRVQLPPDVEREIPERKYRHGIPTNGYERIGMFANCEAAKTINAALHQKARQLQALAEKDKFLKKFQEGHLQASDYVASLFNGSSSQPWKEFDTYTTQVLVLLHLWRKAKKIPEAFFTGKSTFYKELKQVVDQTHTQRIHARQSNVWRNWRDRRR